MPLQLTGWKKTCQLLEENLSAVALKSCQLFTSLN
jgi:hypothetical protein